VYDDAGQVSASIDPLGNRTSFIYDLAGQQTAIQDARGNRTTFGYDPAGRLATQVNAVGNLSTWQYDAAGRNTTVVDALGHVKSLTYDSAGRLVRVLYANGDRVSNAYDAGGRRTTMQDWGGTTTWVYDPRGDMVSLVYPGGYRLTLQYDEMRNRTLLQDPDGGQSLSPRRRSGRVARSHRSAGQSSRRTTSVIERRCRTAFGLRTIVPDDVRYRAAVPNCVRTPGNRAGGRPSGYLPDRSPRTSRMPRGVWGGSLGVHILHLIRRLGRDKKLRMLVGLRLEPSSHGPSGARSAG
jgi:YD repeat-containing protein